MYKLLLILSLFFSTIVLTRPLKFKLKNYFVLKIACSSIDECNKIISKLQSEKKIESEKIDLIKVNQKIINKEGNIWKNFLFTFLYFFYLGLHLA